MNVLYVAETLAVVVVATTIKYFFKWRDGCWREREITARHRAWDRHCGYRVTQGEVN
jgi:predicted CDP-diglyceride synthetase/phosphatidate cytidylyltransferase